MLFPSLCGMQLPVSLPALASTRALANQNILDFLILLEKFFIFLQIIRNRLLENNPSNTKNNMKSQIENQNN